jgi:hypothetical protein
MNRLLRSFLALSVVAGATSIGLTSTPASAAPAKRSLKITSPSAPMVASGPISIRGTLGSGDQGGTVVLFAVDVSGSTSSPRQDCSGDGLIDTNDDLNGDGSQGDVLDCEIASVTAMVTSIAGRGDLQVGLIGYGSDAAAADLSPKDGEQSLVSVASPKQGERDRIPDIINVATSLTQGSIGLFTSHSVGGGTSFRRPLEVAETVFQAEEQRRAADGDTEPFNKVVLLLSDGQASISAMDTEVVALQARGATANTYAVGAGAGQCEAGDPLRIISDELSGTCTSVQNPSTLAAAIEGTEGDEISVTLKNKTSGATLGPVDTTTGAFGDWSAAFPKVPPGKYEAVARSGDLKATRTFTVRLAGTGISYAALGDSYSSGEGKGPWRNEIKNPPNSDELDDECHRSTKGYPMQVKLPKNKKAIAYGSDSKNLFSFAACSGAISQNLLYVNQRPSGKKAPLQQDFVNDGTDLVTATIGGNDVEFVEIATHCVTQFNCQKRDGRGSDKFTKLNSGTSLTLPEYVDLRLAIIAAQLPPTYLRIKESSGHNSTVAIAGYPELFQVKPSVFCGTRSIITKKERVYLGEAAQRFDSLLTAATGRAGVFYSPVLQDFSPHLPCGDGEVWLNGVSKGGLKDSRKLHPTDAGYKAYADIINGDLAGWIKDPPRGLKPTGLPFNPKPTAALDKPASLRSVRAEAAPEVSDDDDEWVDEGADPTPVVATDLLEGVETDGLSVGAGGVVAFDPWLAVALPDLPQVSVDDLRAVARSVVPTLTLTNPATECLDTASAGQPVSLFASGFAPGETVALESEQREGVEPVQADSVADSAGVASFDITMPDANATPPVFVASGPTSWSAASTGVTVINELAGSGCDLTDSPPVEPQPSPTSVAPTTGAAPTTAAAPTIAAGPSASPQPGPTTEAELVPVASSPAATVVATPSPGGPAGNRPTGAASPATPSGQAAGVAQPTGGQAEVAGATQANTGSLARTGRSVGSLLAFAASAVLLGAAALWARRRTAAALHSPK